ncbi:DsbE family thiol:disulfide interchange protein [Aurantimonas sp. VKM B-3413]|uniref:DsbE family thiol:disulfide interchange protein n=1 Tax=Aurantimonas sp. VKM B-3413 TaxID=2779401 RepID=UPI001E329686|nr:DsbE family thiol:disulfide interchange protein [Aurantimonas sp. VKM B-3413]MCB8839197.1 DsbE family thiol:disulfide interchange protein [Aurantimonas sp. VKM B-3413]
MSEEPETPTLIETAPADQSPTAAAGAGRRRRNWLVLLPLVVFGGLAAVFLAQLVAGRAPNEVPSVLIGKTAPETTLPPLEGVTRADGTPMPGLDLTGFGDGRPVLVNVFASWCAPCREEHPLLMQLARDKRFRLVAINYKDKPENARKFLQSLGNPYDAIGVDEKGAATIDWGVYGVPETFLVAPDGEILYKQTGPFTPQAIERGLMPALAEALKREPKGVSPVS